jgi:hypothetical protein
VDTVGFDKDGIEKALSNPEDNGINDLAFGAIQLDEKGTILQYKRCGRRDHRGAIRKR